MKPKGALWKLSGTIFLVLAGYYYREAVSIESDRIKHRALEASYIAELHEVATINQTTPGAIRSLKSSNEVATELESIFRDLRVLDPGIQLARKKHQPALEELAQVKSALGACAPHSALGLAHAALLSCVVAWCENSNAYSADMLNALDEAERLGRADTKTTSSAQQATEREAVIRPISKRLAAASLVFHSFTGRTIDTWEARRDQLLALGKAHSEEVTASGLALESRSNWLKAGLIYLLAWLLALSLWIVFQFIARTLWQDTTTNAL